MDLATLLEGTPFLVVFKGNQKDDNHFREAGKEKEKTDNYPYTPDRRWFGMSTGVRKTDAASDRQLDLLTPLCPLKKLFQRPGTGPSIH